MSVIAKTLDFAKDSGRFLYYYVVKPQELRSSLKKRKTSELLLSIAALLAFIFTLPFLKLVGHITISGGTATEVTEPFLVKLMWEVHLIMLVALMAFVFAGMHWLLGWLLGEGHSFRELFLVSVHIVGALVFLLLAGWYVFALAEGFNLLRGEWGFLDTGLLFSLFFYSMIVQVINFPPFRAGAWAMVLLSAPSIFMEAETFFAP